jgi:hypothetical protein
MEMQLPGPPSGLGEQVKPAAQSVACAQPVLQAAAAQAKGVQLVTDVGAQWPAPSQTDAASSRAVPDWQAAAPQPVPCG